MKSAKQKKKDLKSAAGLLEDAIELLRDSPGLLSIYYIGSLPFILALIFFWTDMLMNAFAFRRLAAAALGVSICFVWMKAWQSVYTARVIDKVKGEASSSGFKTFVASLITQTAIQPWGFIILPVAMVLTVPFGKAYAFFQNATVEGGANGTDIR